jgi:hypothetical protein
MKSIVSLTFTAILVGALLAATPPLRAQGAASKYAPLPYPPRGLHGQALVDMELAKHPELKLLILHVTPPGVPADSDKDRAIMFSDIGRIGKPDNDEDIGVFRSRQEHVEAQATAGTKVPPWSITAPPKFEVLTILYDRAGNAIGLAGIIFPYKQGDDTAKLTTLAHEIRDDLKTRIDSKDQLFDPAS